MLPGVTLIRLCIGSMVFVHSDLGRKSRMTGDCHVRFCERFRGETPLYLLDFIHIRLFVNHLVLFLSHCQTAPTLPRSTNLFCFFERGQS